MKKNCKRLSVLLCIMLLIQSGILGVIFSFLNQQAMAATNSVKVQMYNAATTGTTSTINPQFRIVNTGTSSVSLSSLKIRYYYTVDGDKTQNFFCDYSTIGSSNVTGTFVKMPTAQTGADYYLEIGFTTGAGSLAANASADIQTRFVKYDWTNYTQTGDYSFNSTGTTFADWNKVTASIQGTLVWGTVPGGTTTPTPTNTPTPKPTNTPTPIPTNTPTPTPIPTNTNTSAPNVQIYYTTSGASIGCIPQSNVTFAPYSATSGTQIYVNPDITYQTFQGFGSSFEGSTVYNLSQLTDANRDSVMQSLFDRTNGANWNLMRICFGTSDFSSESFYSYDDMPKGQTDESLSNFSIQKDIDRNIITRVKEAIKKNPGLRIFATPWSPPGWMKDNDDLCHAGKVKPQYYNVLAQYYCKAIQAYRNYGIPIYAMTLQNEPTIGDDTSISPTCLFSAENERDFIKVLAGELRKNNLTTKLWIYDDSFMTGDGGAYTLNYISTIMDDKAAAAVVDGIGFHDYNSIADSSILSTIHNKYPNVPLYLTERSVHDTNGADRLIQYFRNWIESYSAWLTFLDDNGLPNLGSNNGIYPIQPVRAPENDINNYRLTNDYYMYEQFSKFIQRGAVRIDSDGGNSSTVTTVAFKNPDGSIVLVAANQKTTAQTVKILTNEGQVVNTIPALTVATFKWTPNTYIALNRTGWTAAASPTSSNCPALSAIDGTANSIWSSGQAQASGQCFQVDMQQQKKFDSITIDAGPYNTDDYARSYQVQVSNDASTWTPVSTGTGFCRLIHSEFSTQTARYIRIVQTGTTGYWWSISEINVYSRDPNASYSTLPVTIKAGNYYMGSVQGSGTSSVCQLNSGAWTDYNVNVPTAGTYRIRCTVSAIQAGQLKWLSNSKDLATLLVPATGSQSWRTVEGEIKLDAGAYTLRMQSLAGTFSVDQLEFAMPPLNPISKAGWTAKAQYTYGTDIASNAIDGNIHSRWSSGQAQANGQWFQVDMGMKQTFNSISLDSGESIGDMGRQVDVYVSNDGTNWGSSLASIQCSGQCMNFDFPRTNARYIKFVQTGTANGNFWSIHEINVYSTSMISNLDRGCWTASAYKTDGTNIAQNAIDSNNNTRWSNGEAQANVASPNEQYFKVDMGNPQIFSGISVDAGTSSGDYFRSCNIQLSCDGQNWSTLISNWTGNGQKMQLYFVPQVARYIKLIQTGSAGGNYWSIHELNVQSLKDLTKGSDPLSKSGWTASASTRSGSDAAQNAVDSYSGTKWTPSNDSSSLTVDMGAVNIFNEIILVTNDPSSPKSYAVYLSNDGTTWSNVVAQGTSSDSNIRISFQPKTARYIKIQQTGSSWPVYDVNAYNTYGLNVLPTSGWIAVAYRSNGTDVAANTIDGVLNTRWANGEAQASGQSFQVNMQKQTSFSLITLNTDLSPGDYPMGYEVFVSNDGINWSKIASGACWSDDITVTFNPQTAQYIKINQTGSATDHYWSINEMNVIAGIK